MSTRVDVDALSGAVQRVEHHVNELEKIVGSLREDEQIFFPYYTGHHPHQDYYERSIGELSRAIMFLKEFSKNTSAVINVCKEFDEEINPDIANHPRG